ncbi:type IV toxin-antitoxin system AbiEi family antitoxin domain-containing protein [Pseudoflavitalea rhizosphaerae]|uniref:type IV toxin-antitoxin system AbiEi family antitoxin domain-containing protein n=1 Tax=Pseudoflavitalea rhizosphaerae TaxID=1884793 RepID=UPI0019D13342|nr:hypothetical protein [Pseudoflavitalea rhizosphaerae]
MKIYQAIEDFGAIPIPHHVMAWILRDYRQPNDKIKNLVKDDMLLPVKRGLYIPGKAIRRQQPDPFLIANHIMGPSYVSLDSALSYYALIPEKVFSTTSVTIKQSKKYSTKVGVFTYTRLPLPYYSFGIKSIEVSHNQRFLIATPEKALFDKIITTPGVELRSIKATKAYLDEDLRIDLDVVKSMNFNLMKEWSEHAPKSSSLNMLLETLEAL